MVVLGRQGDEKFPLEASEEGWVLAGHVGGGEGRRVILGTHLGGIACLVVIVV